MSSATFGALRDLLVTLAVTAGVLGFVFALAYLPYYVLLALPDGVGAALCGDAFFCWPTLLAGGVLSVGGGLALLAWLTDRGYLRLPDAW